MESTKPTWRRSILRAVQALVILWLHSTVSAYSPLPRLDR